ncbi:transposase, partial [Escherichia coli]
MSRRRVRAPALRAEVSSSSGLPIWARIADQLSISKLALENGINANLLFKWRQQWREGKLLLPSSESP